jgi:protein-S-isoprenylcysteine O-methyltransferase Ste14
MSTAHADDREERLRVAKELLAVFKVERMAYITATLLAVVFLLVVAVILMSRESYVMALGMFGSSGVIAYSIGQLLRMWNEVLKIIFGPAEGAKP